MIKLFLFLFKTYNKTLFFADPACFNSVHKEEACPLPGQRDALPPTPPDDV